MVRLRAVLVVALALGWSMATAAPAAAMSDKVEAEIDNSRCGVAVITVKNPTGHEVEYKIGVTERFVTLRIADSERKHEFRAVDRQEFFFGGGSDVVETTLTYRAPDEKCKTQRFNIDNDVSCTNAMITIANTGEVEVPDLRVLANEREIAAGTIPVGGSFGPVVFEPQPNETSVRVSVQ